MKHLITLHNHDLKIKINFYTEKANEKRLLN